MFQNMESCSNGMQTLALCHTKYIHCLLLASLGKSQRTLQPVYPVCFQCHRMEAEAKVCFRKTKIFYTAIYSSNCYFLMRYIQETLSDKHLKTYFPLTANINAIKVSL